MGGGSGDTVACACTRPGRDSHSAAFMGICPARGDTCESVYIGAVYHGLVPSTGFEPGGLGMSSLRSRIYAGCQPGDPKHLPAHQNDSLQYGVRYSHAHYGGVASWPCHQRLAGISGQHHPAGCFMCPASRTPIGGLYRPLIVRNISCRLRAESTPGGIKGLNMASRMAAKPLLGVPSPSATGSASA